MPKLKLPPHVAELNGGLTEIELKGRPKYGNTRITVDGISFDSLREAEVYSEHLLRQRAGQIRDLVAHPRYPLEAYGKSLGYYEADMSYYDLAIGAPIVVDVKSQPTRTALYRLKRRLFEAQYQPLKITEVE